MSHGRRSDTAQIDDGTGLLAVRAIIRGKDVAEGGLAQNMIWCRKVWRDIAAFSVESCPEAVEVNRTLLCGRLPAPPDPDAIAEADKWGQVTVKPRNDAPTDAMAGPRSPRLSVTMRDKGDAAQTEEGAAARSAGCAR